jgi:nucleoside phosphorylase
LKIYQIRSSAESAGSNGSTVVALEAITLLQPDFVISTGICFGAEREEQKLCEIVVSTAIFHYESARVTDGDYESRGQKLPASELLLAACQQIRKIDSVVHFGVIASGEKLVDDKEFVDYLHSCQSQIVAGEMEGTGISSACQRERLDWIMIRGF